MPRTFQVRSFKEAIDQTGKIVKLQGSWHPYHILYLCIKSVEEEYLSLTCMSCTIVTLTNGKCDLPLPALHYPQLERVLYPNC
ncbi:hypothetical protein AB205_0117540 [Aquarana catesbeiana]|uniref:Uncharacterized protein n=1 Tax=Aquarana catesbeiana TaxID=8400 RepID=A0A2G9RQV7_AQUCT|nr:hypothetical protein AB205_0117540 [Aquarana catesbeiana]